MSVRLLGAIFLMASLPILASAATSVSCPALGRTTVYYVNGVWNFDKDDADDSRRLLEVEARQAFTWDWPTVDFATQFNPSDGYVGDLIEVADQAQQISNWSDFWKMAYGLSPVTPWFRAISTGLVGALTAITEIDYQPALDNQVQEYQKAIADGRKVVLVAHSQGNFFANESARALTSRELRSFAIVSVANPDSSVVTNVEPHIIVPHVTLVEDLVIGAVSAARLTGGLGPAMPPTITNLPAISRDWSFHAFADTYLQDSYPAWERNNSRQQIVANTVTAARGIETPQCSVANQPPIAAFTARIGATDTDTVAVGQQITFDPTGSNDPDGSIVGYEWSFGDGPSVANGSPTPVGYTYSSPGTKTVRLTVTDNGGLTRFVEHTITVTQNAVPAGSFDSSFASTGWTITPDAFYDARAVAITSDDRIVVGGLGLIKYRDDGVVDTSFGQGGIASTAGYVIAIAIDAQGRIVTLEAAANVSIISRYSAGGALDTSFGQNGRVSVDVYFVAIVIDSVGRLVVAGSTGGAAPEFVIARLDPAGTLDGTFGSGGVVVTGIANSAGDAANALAIDSQGRIVVAGTTFNPNASAFATVRLTNSGQGDPTFGENGWVVTAFHHYYYGDLGNATAVMIDSADQVVVAGTAMPGGDFALAKYLVNGQLDPSFGVGGKLNMNVIGYDSVYSAVMDSSGRIIVGGWAKEFGNYNNAALVRFNQNGLVDASFGTNGVIITAFNTYNSIHGVAIDSRGRIVVAGDASIDAFVTTIPHSYVARFNP